MTSRSEDLRNDVGSELTASLAEEQAIAHRRNRPIAYMEDKLSMHSRNILPILAERFPIIIITTDTNIPAGEYYDVIKVPEKRYEMQMGFAFAKIAERLYRNKGLAFAYTYNCSGFALRHVPYLHLFGGSFLKNCVEYYKFGSWLERIKLIPGFLHYVVPEAITAFRAKKVIAKVGDLRDDLVHYYGRSYDSIDVISNGVGEDFLNLYSKKDPKAEATILFTGRLHRDKGIVPFTEAFLEHPEIKATLIVVGDGPEMPKMIRFSASDGRIKLLGKLNTEEIKGILARTNIFVFPGIIGGFSCSLLEGMASGHACIAYDLKGNREALQGAGFLVEYYQPHAFCRQLAQVVRDKQLRQRYSQLAHERAMSFSWSAFADKLSRAFDEMYELVDGPMRES